MSNALVHAETSVFDPVRQRASAMARANATRTAISEFKADVKARTHEDGCRCVSQFLLDPDEVTSAIRTRMLLKAIRQMGDGKADIFIHAAGIFNADKRVRDLTYRQRKALADELRWRARG